MTDQGPASSSRELREQGLLHTDEHMPYHRPASNLTIHDPLGAGAYPEDTGVPAQMGVYSAQRILTMARLLQKGQNPPAGLYITIEVDHHT